MIEAKAAQHLVGTALRRAASSLQVAYRNFSPAGRQTAKLRAEVDAAMATLSRNSRGRYDGVTLVDATFDNPNYWFRTAQLRAALGLSQGREIGMLGEYRKRECRATLQQFGITQTVRIDDEDAVRSMSRLADEFLRRTKSAEDILAWEFPGGVPALIVYDGILKRQRVPMVDIHRSDFAPLVRQALGAIEQGRRILDQQRYDLIVASHPFNYTIGALAWQALDRNIPVVFPYGAFGVLRFTRFAQPTDLFDFYDRPTGAEIDALDPAKAAALREIGHRYLESRLAGFAGDLPSRYAFQQNRGHIDRTTLCEMAGWDPAKPIIAFYAQNWFDWPHQLGMTQFRDFLDWTEATIQAAQANADVNWLLKAHPCETWFGGIGLTDILARSEVSPPHIALAKSDWNNGQVLRLIDGLVTYHSTAGIEAAAIGKPVLVADRGKYHDGGFVKLATSRRNYLDLLGSNWWEDMDLAQTRRRAEIFSGWWFCAPDWQRDYLLGEDGDQDALNAKILDLINTKRPTLDREIDEIASWWNSGHRFYHTTKMANAGGYWLSNAAA
jgi:hypothetical protein